MTLGQSSYRWILYGDDDTYFNVDAALRMVNGLDHRTPYLLSDNIWFPAQNGGFSHSDGALFLLLVRRHVLDWPRRHALRIPRANGGRNLHPVDEERFCWRVSKRLC